MNSDFNVTDHFRSEKHLADLRKIADAHRVGLKAMEAFRENQPWYRRFFKAVTEVELAEVYEEAYANEMRSK